MKRILALVNSYQSEIRERQYDIILEQVKSYALEADITLLHMVRHDKLDKQMDFKTDNLAKNLKVITVNYTIGTPISFWQKFRATFEVMNIGRMITQVLTEKIRYDQIHLHESWPLIMLAREINILQKIPFFLFEYDNDYIYSSYRKRNKLSIFPYLAVLFSAQGVVKIFGHTPKLIRRLSKNLNIKNKAVIIPLAVDTQFFYPDSSIPRSCIYSELNAENQQEVDIVYHMLFEFCNSHEDIQFHLLLKNSLQYEIFETNILPENLNIHYRLDNEEKSQFLRMSKFCVILNNNLQEIQLMNQSLCCGTPILSRNSVAIIDDLNSTNSQIMEEDDYVFEAMKKMLQKDFDHMSIAQNAMEIYSPARVAKILSREIKNY